MEESTDNFGTLDSFRFRPEEKIEIKKLPQAAFADIPAHLPPRDIEKVPKKKNILLLFILSLITLGIYPTIWYFKRGPELYNLGTQKKLSPTLPTILLILDILFVALIIIIPLTITVNFEQMGDFWQNPPMLTSTLIFGLAIVILFRIFFSLLVAFYTRSVINQAIENKGSQKKISGLFTFVFCLFYLQYEIDRIIDDKENEPMIGPWMFLIIVLVLTGLALVNYFVLA